MANRDAILNFKTPYAQKYGVLPIEHDKLDLFFGDGKSGVTPTRPKGLHPPSAMEAARNERIEHEQKRFLWGFTAQQLVELGCYPDPNATLSVLNNSIHPIFQRDHWETHSKPFKSQRFFQIEAKGDCFSQGVDGSWWLATNPLVWDILQPILKIVSRLLADSLTIPLLDTILCGNYYSLPLNEDPRSDEERQQHGPLWLVQARHPSQYGDPEMLKHKYEALSLLESKIRLKIGDGAFDHDNVGLEPVFAYGSTMPDFDPDDYMTPPLSVDIQIAWQILLPLLRNDLSPSERLMEQFLCASTLIHETMHAIHASLSYCDIVNKPWYIPLEPIYEPLIFSEAGFAIEVELHTGAVIDVPHYANGNPHVCVFVASHPNRLQGTSENQIVRRGEGAIPMDTFVQPLPSKYFYNINDNIYWDHAVRRWGVDMIRPQAGPNCIIDHTKKARIHTSKLSPASLKWETDMQTEFLDKDPRLELLNKTPEEVAAWKTALEIDRATVETLKRTEFRSERVALGLRIRKWLDPISAMQADISSSSSSSDSEVEDQPSLTPEYSYALDALLAESYTQAEEIITFKLASITTSPTEPYNLEWLHYLQRINREMRTFHQELSTLLASQNLESYHVTKLENTIAILITSFRILNSTRADVHYSTTQDWKKILDTAWAAIKPSLPLAMAEAKVWDEANYNPRAEQDFWMQLLVEGQSALLKGEEEKCKELGLECFRQFGWSAFMRAVGTMLLSRSGVDGDLELWRVVEDRGREALSGRGGAWEVDLEDDAGEVMRRWWSEWLEEVEEEARLGERARRVRAGWGGGLNEKRGVVAKGGAGATHSTGVGSSGTQSGRVTKKTGKLVPCVKRGSGSGKKGRSVVDAYASAEMVALVKLQRDAMDAR